MWADLLRLSVRSTPFALTVLGIVGGIGIYGLLHLQVDAVPDITNNQVQVYAYAPGYSAAEVELLVTRPLEAALATLPGRIEWRSISRTGLSLITIVFPDQTNIHEVRAQIVERLLSASDKLPPGIQPELGPLATGLSEAYQYVLRPRVPVSLTELRAIQDWIVRRALLETPGVADISSFGGYVRRWEIFIQPEALQRYHLTLSEVENALQTQHQLQGAGYIERSSQVLPLRTEGIWRTPQELLQSTVAQRHGYPVRLGDIGHVAEGHLPRYGALIQDTLGEVVGGIVLVRRGENTAQVIARLKERIQTLEPRLPYGIRIEPFLDREALIHRVIHTVRDNLLKAALIVIGVLTILLGSWRAGLVVSAVIPLSMLFALGLMSLTGISANLMSLGAIDFGLLVDGTVILVEAVLVRLPHMPNRIQATEEAAITIRQAALFGEMVVIAVYVPFLLLAGVEGRMFRPMVLTMVFALIGALILSVTFVPWVSARFLDTGESSFASTLQRGMGKLATWLFQGGIVRPWLPLFLWLTVLTGGLALFLTMDSVFLPELDEGAFAVETRLPAGTPLSRTIEYCHKIHQLLLREMKEAFSGAVAKIGTSEIPMDPMFVESADLILNRHSGSSYSRAAAAESLKALVERHYPGIFIGVQQPIQMRFNELMAGSRTDIVVRLLGPDLDSLYGWGERIASFIEGIDGVDDLARPLFLGTSQMVIRWKPEALRFYGVDLSEAQRWILAYRAGLPLRPFYSGEGWRFAVALRLASPPALPSQLLLPTQSGQWVRLEQIADVVYVPSYNEIPHAEGERAYAIGINVRRKGVLSVVEAIQRKIAELPLPPGYRVSLGGQWENYRAARERLLWVIPLMVLLIGGLMYATLHRFSAIFSIMLVSLSAPAGGVILLWMRDMPFSISAAVGLISVFGLATLNGTVLLNRYYALSTLSEASMRHALQERARPILATMLVAVAGLLPMAFSTQAGAEVQQPLATTVIGGLITGALFNLWLLPLLYAVPVRRFVSLRYGGTQQMGANQA
ncbi:MAG: CusA/CzcA family heavy metal efflux RND transporter [Bacteroidia bacterium]|nr:CusA/CzcA family heavy metal efflux RND transporter [Bacteroidia bacterium]MDW8235197.1 CusA/CzcA family heavy metal efflux RND transporter [Bacteroidia bacterium]